MADGRGDSLPLQQDASGVVVCLEQDEVSGLPSLIGRHLEKGIGL